MKGKEVTKMQHYQSTDEILEQVLSLGLLQPRWGSDKALPALAQVGASRAAGLLYGHKVSSIARDTVVRLAEGAPLEITKLLEDLVQQMAEKSSRIRRRWLSADSVERLVTDIADREGIPWWQMKGFSFRRRYPSDACRDVGDLDVLVASIDDAWLLARRLRQDRYAYPAGELPWFKRDVRDGNLYGQIRLVDPEGGRLSVDIHAGPYSVRHCAVMPLRRSGDGAPGTCISLDDDICSVIANAAGDCIVNAKLINDLVLVLDKDFDADYIQETLDTAGLLPFLATCLKRLMEWCSLTPEQEKGFRRLTPHVEPEETPPLAAADPGKRCEVTVAHARLIAERMFPGQPDHVEAVVDTAQRAYGEDHPLHVIELPERASRDLPELNNWTCVRLVPMELAAGCLTDSEGHTGGPAVERGRQALSEQLSLLRFDEGVAVQASDEVFLPTVDFALSGTFVRTVAAR